MVYRSIVLPAAFLALCNSVESFTQPSISLSNNNFARQSSLRSTATDEEVDCIVIGSGIGGLSCAGLLAATGRKVKVLEKHDKRMVQRAKFMYLASKYDIAKQDQKYWKSIQDDLLGVPQCVLLEKGSVL